MTNLSRLRWRCRRGMKELDFLFERFLDDGFNFLTEKEKADFERLLETQDDRLWAWFFQKETVEDDAFAVLVERIRASVDS